MQRFTLTTQGQLTPTVHGEYCNYAEARDLLRKAMRIIRGLNSLMPRDDASHFLQYMRTEHRIEEI